MRIRAILAATFLFLSSFQSSVAQLPPPITPPATGSEKVTCVQGGTPKTCTTSQIAALAGTLSAQSANTVLAGPVSGASAVPAYRSLAVPDLTTASGMVRVDTNAALLALATTTTPRVMRLGFTTAGDAPPLVYIASGSACTLNGGNGDNGSQVKSADNKCWIANFPAGIIPISEFGAIPNDGLDDTAAIQQAFNYGGGLYCPDGDYRVTSGISIAKTTEFHGNYGSCIFVTTVATGDVIDITGPTPESGALPVTITGITFNTAITRSSGSYIHVTNGVYNVAITWCLFQNGYDHVVADGAGGFGFYVENTIHYYATHISIIVDNSSLPTVKAVLFNVNILGPSAETNSVAGVKLGGVGDITLNRVDTVRAGKGLWIAPVAGRRVQLAKVIDSTFDSGTDWGIDITTDGGNVDALKIVDSWVGTNLGGIRWGATGNGGLIRQTDVINTIGSNNTLQGFLVGANATNTQINASSASANGSDGIRVAANTNAFKIIGNTTGPSGEFGGNGGSGINILTGTSNGYIVSLNIVDNNTGTNIIDGGSGGTKYVGNNI